MLIKCESLVYTRARRAVQKNKKIAFRLGQVKKKKVRLPLLLCENGHRKDTHQRTPMLHVLCKLLRHAPTPKCLLTHSIDVLYVSLAFASCRQESTHLLRLFGFPSLPCRRWCPDVLHGCSDHPLILFLSVVQRSASCFLGSLLIDKFHDRDDVSS